MSIPSLMKKRELANLSYPQGKRCLMARKIKSQQDGAEGVSLGDAIVATVGVGGGQAVPEISSGALVQKVGDEGRDFTIEPKFTEESGDDVRVH